MQAWTLKLVMDAPAGASLAIRSKTFLSDLPFNGSIKESLIEVMLLIFWVIQAPASFGAQIVSRKLRLFVGHFNSVVFKSIRPGRATSRRN
jgi:hypothetical protein